jgi:hypothetical protein
VGEAYRGLALGALLLLAGCAREVLLVSPDAGSLDPPSIPVPLTVSILPGSFEKSRLRPEGVLERFADALRDARLFEGVLYPVPSGVTTRWEIELLAGDEAFEPDSNFWKSALAAALFPTAVFVKLENDYALRLEALLLQDRVVVGSYLGEARIRHRYGPYANRQAADAEGVEVAVSTATRLALGALAADLDRIEQANRR